MTVTQESDARQEHKTVIHTVMQAVGTKTRSRLEWRIPWQTLPPIAAPTPKGWS